MIDHALRPAINPGINFLGKHLARIGVKADHITLVGFFLGLLAAFSISQKFYMTGLFFIVLNRLSDGLDGAIARHTSMTDFGSILDIVFDFIFYASIPLAFAFVDEKNTTAGLILLFSFIGTMASFLAYAIVAEKHGMQTSARGRKTFYHMGGICEGFETFLAFTLMCLMPNHFTIIAYVFSILCFLTTIGRIYQARLDF